MISSDKNYYQLLNIKHKASFEEIKEAYRKLVKTFHPDKHVGDKFFEDYFRNIKEAYEVLSDPVRRSQFDKRFFTGYSTNKGYESSTQQPTNEQKGSSRENVVIVRISVDKETIHVGSVFHLTFIVNHPANGLSFTSFDGFEIITGPSTITSIENEKFSKSFSYVLFAKKDGEFIIPSGQVLLSNGKSVNTDKKRIIVFAAKEKSKPYFWNKAPKINFDKLKRALSILGFIGAIVLFINFMRSASLNKIDSEEYISINESELDEQQVVSNTSKEIEDKYSNLADKYNKYLGDRIKSRLDSVYKPLGFKSIEPIKLEPFKDIKLESPRFKIHATNSLGKHLNNGDSPYDEYFGKGVYDEKSYNKINFLNKPNYDVIVGLVDNNSNRTIRNEYIRSGTSFEMTNIPNGFYYIKSFYGTNWNPERQIFDGQIKGAFDTDLNFSKSDNPTDLLKMYQFETLDGVNYSTYEITLYTVVGGNMESEAINEDDFFEK